MRALPLLVVLTLVACEKQSTPEIAPSKEVASARPAEAGPPVVAIVVADAGAPAVAAVASTPSAAPEKPKEAARTSASSSASVPAAPTAPKSVAKHVDGKNYGLDIASSGCKADTECAVTIKLVTADTWHVNKEYPYKFVGTAAPNVTFLGKSDAATFTRAAGDFTEQGEKTGIMTVRFKASAPGETHVAGTYKFSVCSADQCQIEQQKLDLAVPVM